MPALQQRPDTVTMKGNPIKLLGSPVNIGDAAPEATLAANDLAAKKISDFRGKTTIISVVPSLDTGICDLQTKRFNKEAAALGGAVQVLTISRDLPFAQKRWCGAADAHNVITLSDYKSGAFGKAWGILLEGLELLARAVFVVDADGKIVYAQYVPEITTEPDYNAVIAAVKAL